MASSRPDARRTTAANNRDTEPFPSMPDSPAGPSFSDNNTNTTTTTTTVHGPTITTTISRGRPYTITSGQPVHQSQLRPQTPSSVVSAPGHSTTTSAVPTTTRTFLAAPSGSQRPISIRRLPSSNLRAGYEDDAPSRSASGRGRSTSAPQQPQHLNVPGSNNLARQSTRQSMLSTVAENPQAGGSGDAVVDRDTMNENVTGAVGRTRSVSNAARSMISRFSDSSRDRQGPEYESEVVDLLDVLGRFPQPASGTNLLTNTL